ADGSRVAIDDIELTGGVLAETRDAGDREPTARRQLGGAIGELGHHSAGVPEGVDVVGAEVGEEVPPLDRRNRSAIGIAAGDRAAEAGFAVAVLVDWEDVLLDAGRVASL